MQKNNTPKPAKQNNPQTDICPYAKKCGGCDYQGIPYAKQLSIKQQEMEKLLGGFAKVYPIIGMEDPTHYRNKVHAVLDRDRKGNIISGVYEKNSHRVVNVDSCMIEDERADAIVLTIRKLIKDFKMKVFDEDTGYGLLRHVMVRSGKKTGQIMVVLVTSNPMFPSKKNFAKALIDRHPEITTVVQNINQKATSMVLGERNQILYGRGYIEDVLCGKRFKLSPTSFYQVNPVQTEVLYNKAMEYAALTGEEIVIDAYCGIGTIGIVASDKAKEVIGVELNKEAIRDAITNAKINGCKNIDFYNNDAGKFMVGLASQDKKVDVVFMDPPRSGSSKEFMDSVLKLMPNRVVYISCGPESLARDLKYMTRKGLYKVEKMVACDMFPFTTHVECIACIQRID